MTGQHRGVPCSNVQGGKGAATSIVAGEQKRPPLHPRKHADEDAAERKAFIASARYLEGLQHPSKIPHLLSTSKADSQGKRHVGSTRYREAASCPSKIP
jgi:hypothetical protein